MTIPDVFKSSKFYFALGGLAIALFGERVGIDGLALGGALSIIASYILGVALEDGLKAR